jgi:hypothetical protein
MGNRATALLVGAEPEMRRLSGLRAASSAQLTEPERRCPNDEATVVAIELKFGPEGRCTGPAVGTDRPGPTGRGCDRPAGIYAERLPVKGGRVPFG